MRKLKGSQKRNCKYCRKDYVATTGYKWGSFCSKNCGNRSRLDRDNPWVERDCKDCSATFRVKLKNQVKKRCQLCAKSRRSYMEAERFSVSRANKNKEIACKENQYLENQEKFKDMIIDYNASPSGKKAFIGLAKLPLMVNDNGIGFKGVKIQTVNRELIQCSECSEWLQSITATHLSKHKLSLLSYRKKFGLNKRSPLVSDVFSNWASSNAVHLVRTAVSYRDKPQQGLRSNGWPDSVERQNLFGTCPKQIKSKFIEYIHRFKRIPSSQGGNRGFGNLGTIRYRFGNVNNYLKILGLPTRKQMGRIVEYNFSDGSKYFTRSGMGYEELYRVMMKKCPILSS